MRIKKFKFLTLEHAWEGINEYLANDIADIEKYGGFMNGNQVCLYNCLVVVDKAWVNPTFDFANILGYTIRKWTKLVSNYVDLNYLDLVKAEVLAREKKKTQNYTHSFHFSNKHDSGKDCLISLTFCRCYGKENPVVIYHTRAVEATKRMIFDFLLIQRIIEYVYGPDKQVEVLMFIPFMFITIEGVLLYTNHRPIKELMDKECARDGLPNKLQTKVLKCYDHFMETPVEKIKYKVHARSARGIQKDANGKPIHGRVSLLAKDLFLHKETKATTLHLLEKLNKEL